MYDPQLGRWNSIDPLMEWHFNTTPYNYCFNNPINYIDPFGMDTVYVSDPDKQISEIVITAKKIKKNWFQRAWNWLKNPDSGDGGAEEILPESLMGDSEYDQMIGTGTRHPGTNSSLNKKGTGTEEDLSSLGSSPNNIGNLFDIVKALGVEGKTDQKTTDKEIVETKTGTGEKTDANGKPVKKQQSIRKGAETDTLEQYHKNDSSSVWLKEHDGNREGKSFYYKGYRKKGQIHWVNPNR